MLQLVRPWAVMLGKVRPTTPIHQGMASQFKFGVGRNPANLVNRRYMRVAIGRENFNERCPRLARNPERRRSTRLLRPAGNDPRRQRVAKIRHHARFWSTR